jgi:hypothetical protein
MNIRTKLKLTATTGVLSCGLGLVALDNQSKALAATSFVGGLGAAVSATRLKKKVLSAQKANSQHLQL